MRWDVCWWRMRWGVCRVEDEVGRVEDEVGCV